MEHLLKSLMAPPRDMIRPDSACHTIRLHKDLFRENVGRPSSKTAYRKKLGIRFEKAAHEYLRQRYPHEYLDNMWISFITRGGRKRVCSPDAVVLDCVNKRALILEMKFTHTHRAWHQLLSLYRPVVSKLLPNYSLSFLEVVKCTAPDPRFKVTFTHTPEFPTVPTILVLSDLEI